MAPTTKKKRKTYDGVKVRSVRVEDELWQASLAKAERTGTSVSEVVRKALVRYTTPPKPKSTTPSR